MKKDSNLSNKDRSKSMNQVMLSTHFGIKVETLEKERPDTKGKESQREGDIDENEDESENSSEDEPSQS